MYKVIINPKSFIRLFLCESIFFHLYNICPNSTVHANNMI